MAQIQISIYTLSNFILMEEAEPEDSEVYLLITKFANKNRFGTTEFEYRVSGSKWFSSA